MGLLRAACQQRQRGAPPHFVCMQSYYRWALGISCACMKCMRQIWSRRFVFFLDPGAAMAEMLVEVSDRPGVRFLRKPMKLTISESLVYQLCVRGCMLCCVLGMVCGG